jgi:hypothetical protein
MGPQSRSRTHFRGCLGGVGSARARGVTASRRVLEKAGYRFVGVLRKGAVKHGEVIDQALYDLTRD